MSRTEADRSSAAAGAEAAEAGADAAGTASARGVSRRALIHGAWAAPVVLVAVAAPAAAASDPVRVDFGVVRSPFVLLGVSTFAADGTGVASPFVFQGQVGSGPWVTITEGPLADQGPTNDQGSYYTQVAFTEIAYDGLRVVAVVNGTTTISSAQYGPWEFETDQP